MIVGFFTDHKFVTFNGNVYTTGSLEAEIWSKYLVHGVEQLKVFGRETKFQKPRAKSYRPGVKFHFLKDYSNLNSLLFSNNQEIREAVSSVDFVICRLPSEIGYRAISEAIKVGKKVYAEVVACPSDNLSNYGNFVAKAYSWVAFSRMRKAVQSAQFVTYVTQEFLQKRYPAKIDSITSAISDVSIPFTKTVSRSVSWRKGGLIKIGLIGSPSSKIKGVDVAIKALSLLLECELNVELRVLGGDDLGRNRKFINKFGVEERVHCEGFLVSRDEVFAWLDSLDIYIQPSYTEGLPRAVVEAMSRGLPVVATNVGGMSELVNNNYLFSPGNFRDLANLIKDLIGEPNEYEVQSKQSLLVSARFIDDLLASQREEFYYEFLRPML